MILTFFLIVDWLLMNKNDIFFGTSHSSDGKLWRMTVKWPHPCRWVLVKALIKLWQALAIDFPLERVASLKMPVRCTQHCGKAIKLKSFLLLQILRLTNNSSFFFLSSNQYDADLFTLKPQYFLSPALIGMNSSVSKVHAHRLWESEPISLNGVRSFSRQVTSKPRCSAVHGVTPQEALENGGAPPQDWRSLARGSRHALGLPKITTSY